MILYPKLREKSKINMMMDETHSDKLTMHILLSGNERYILHPDKANLYCISCLCLIGHSFLKFSLLYNT